jgi:hypothetical protein
MLSAVLSDKFFRKRGLTLDNLNITVNRATANGLDTVPAQ